MSEYVLASAALVSPPLYGTLRRVVPYCSLSTLEFLDIPGFIAGVSNPVFKLRTNWYDICCEIETGIIFSSNPD